VGTAAGELYCPQQQHGSSVLLVLPQVLGGMSQYEQRKDADLAQILYCCIMTTLCSRSLLQCSS